MLLYEQSTGHTAASFDRFGTLAQRDNSLRVDSVGVWTSARSGAVRCGMVVIGSFRQQHFRGVWSAV